MNGYQLTDGIFNLSSVSKQTLLYLCLIKRGQFALGPRRLRGSAKSYHVFYRAEDLCHKSEVWDQRVSLQISTIERTSHLYSSDEQERSNTAN